MQFDILVKTWKVPALTGAIHHNLPVLQLSPRLPLSGLKAKRRKAMPHTRRWEICLQGVNPSLENYDLSNWSRTKVTKHPPLVAQIIVSPCRATTP